MSLIFRGDRQRCLGDSKCSRNVSDVIVTLLCLAGWSDGIFAYILARCSADRYCQNALFVSVLEACCGPCELRILRTVNFAGINRSYRNVRLSDGEGSRDVNNFVVALFCLAGWGDSIFAYVLARCSADCNCQNALIISVLKTVCCPCKGRVSRTIYFIFILSSYCYSCLGDGKCACCIFNIIVTLYRFTGWGNRVGSDVFASFS